MRVIITLCFSFFLQIHNLKFTNHICTHTHHAREHIYIHIHTYSFLFNVSFRVLNVTYETTYKQDYSIHINKYLKQICNRKFFKIKSTNQKDENNCRDFEKIYSIGVYRKSISKWIYAYIF